MLALEFCFSWPQFGRHYWLGLKLLWGDIKTAKKILKRILRGFPMTRRERKQLLRTASDIFRMVPLAVRFGNILPLSHKSVQLWACNVLGVHTFPMNL